MSDDPRQRVLERVRRLLALATSSNVHEASSAAAAAQALVARHRLEAWVAAAQVVEADPDPITDARESPLDRARRQRPWKVALACALADANGCVAYTLDERGSEAIVLVGRGRDRDAVAELWGALLKRIEWLSATQGEGRARSWHEAFRVGVVDALAARLRTVEGEVRAEAPAASMVIASEAEEAHRAALERFVAERLGLGRGRSLRVDAAAWRRGKAAGASMDLAPARRGR